MKGYKLQNKSWEYLNESKRETKDKKNEEGNKKILLNYRVISLSIFTF